MNTFIEKIEYYLPENIETNEFLENQNKDWDLKKISKKSGVHQRHIASSDETAFDLSLKACEKIFRNFNKEKIGGIIYCTQSPDYIMPPNSFLLHKELKFKENVFSFDFNHACTGYIYCILMANSFLSSGMAESILIINSDTYSKYINKKDRSTRVLFGDGAAATIVRKCHSDSRIIDKEISSCGADYNKFWIPAGGLRNPKTKKTSQEFVDFLGNIRSENDITMDGLGVWSFINSVVPNQINQILKRNKLDLSKIDQIIFHQASLMTLESLIKKMKINEEKVYINIKNIGNTVSSSIPIALKDAVDDNIISRGSKIILCGFGVGLSYGTILMEY